MMAAKSAAFSPLFYRSKKSAAKRSFWQEFSAQHQA